MENNEEKVQKVDKKVNKFQKVINFFKGAPKTIKWIFGIGFLVGIFYLGIIFSNVYIYQTKTTKFGLEDVGELVTQTAYLTIVQDNTKNREFFQLFDIPFTESRQIFSYDVEVDASVDFSKISYDIDDENTEITVKLPHAKIYKATLKTDSFKEYLDSESLFSRINLEEHNEALKSIEEQAKKDAEANGVLEAADNNAIKLIEGLIKTDSNYKEYHMNYKYE